MNWPGSNFLKFLNDPRIKNSWVSFFAGAFISLQPGQWSTIYSGHGEVQFSASGLSLKPASALVPTQSHAALVLSKKEVRYFEAEIIFQNLRSLRRGVAQPWEVFWLFFNYQTDNHGQKKTNYLILKPNGLEVGRATQETHQDILKTWEQPVSVWGQEHHLRLQRWSTKLIITLDRLPAVTYEFIRDPEKPFDQLGEIGLYSEDAEVLIKSISLHSL